MSRHDGVVVVGTGLAGLTAAARLAEAGVRVLVLAKAWAQRISVPSPSTYSATTPSGWTVPATRSGA